MSSFDSHYESFHDSRTKLKAKIDSITKSITDIMAISKHDEIASLASATSTSIVEAQFIVTQYDNAVATLKAAINDMDDDQQKHDEQTHFEQQMEQDNIDGGNSIPVSPAGLKSLLRDKIMLYDLSLSETIKRVKFLTSLSSSPSPVIPPPGSSISHQASVPSTLNSSTLPPGLTNSVKEEESNDSVDESAIIGQLSNSISRLIGQISSSNSRPNLALPPVKLETFDGSDMTRWPAFHYQISQLILSQPSLSEVEKAYHVRSSLRGNAFNLVASIPVHEKFLDKIMNRLETQYGRDSLTQAKLIQSLRSIRSKSTSVIDQLSAVQSMISLAHSIHSESGVDSLCVQQMLAECVHPRFITIISRAKPKSLLLALELIESQLLSEHEDALTISAYSTGEQLNSRSNGNSSTAFSPPNNRANQGNNQPNKTPHTGHSASNPKTSNSKKPQCVFCGRHSYSTRVT